MNLIIKETKKGALMDNLGREGFHSQRGNTPGIPQVWSTISQETCTRIMDGGKTSELMLQVY
jgi:hypothetical protein